MALDHCMRETKTPYDRRGGWYEQAENRQDYEALEHVESHSGADALAAQDAPKLIQRHAEYTLGLQWEKTKALGRTKKQMPMGLLPRCALLAQRAFARRATVGWGCYRNGNNQAQSIQCWIVRAKRLQQVNGKVVIFRVRWTESVLLVPP